MPLGFCTYNQDLCCTKTCFMPFVRPFHSFKLKIIFYSYCSTEGISHVCAPPWFVSEEAQPKWSFQWWHYFGSSKHLFCAKSFLNHFIFSRFLKEESEISIQKDFGHVTESKQKWFIIHSQEKISLDKKSLQTLAKCCDFILNPAIRYVASHAGIFMGAHFSSLPTNACSTEDNIPFPSLANHIVLSKFWKVDLDHRVIW